MARASNGGFGRRAALAFMLVLTVSIGTFVLVNLMVVVKLGKAERVDLVLAGSPSGGGGNYLMIGSDTREFSSEDPLDSQRFGEVGGQRSDTIMVLHIDPDSERSLLVSFPRDLWVDIPGRGSAKLNAAFNEGPQSVIDTLSADFNVPIQHYVEVNFESFRQIVDAIGTVNVYFPAPARDAFSTLAIPYPGCADLDGGGALAFVRSRHLELLDVTTGEWVAADPIPDIGRIARQQALLRVIGQKAMDVALTNPFKANSIADAAISQLTLDQDFGRTDAFALAGSFAAGADETGPLTLTIPTTAAQRDGQSVLETTGESEAVLAQLRDFETVVASPASDAAPGDTRVRVLNGSGAEGAAADTLAALTAQGFVGAGTGNADERGTSQVRYRPGEESKAELVASLVGGPVDTVEDDSIEDADVVLVIGAQFEGIVQSSAAAGPTTAPVIAAVIDAPVGMVSAPRGVQPPPPNPLAPIPGGC